LFVTIIIMIIATASQKGGVGKTATSVNLASCLGQRTLLVDLDPQGACSISLGIDPDSLSTTIYDALTERANIRDVILPTSYGFDLAPSNIDLAEAELALAATPGREFALRRALSPVLDSYDQIVIDTPPTLGLLTMNAFAVADSVLIPVSTQLLSLRGLATLMETIEKIRRYSINPELTVLGILPTKYDRRLIHARQVLEYLDTFTTQQGIRLFSPVRATVRFDESVNEHTPFVLLYPDDEASSAFREVAEHVRQT